jgi:uncharacterized membrane protein
MITHDVLFNGEWLSYGQAIMTLLADCLTWFTKGVIVLLVFGVVFSGVYALIHLILRRDRAQ